MLEGLVLVQQVMTPQIEGVRQRSYQASFSTGRVRQSQIAEADIDFVTVPIYMEMHAGRSQQQVMQPMSDNPAAAQEALGTFKVGVIGTVFGLAVTALAAAFASDALMSFAPIVTGLGLLIASSGAERYQNER